jgi:hypothetical protein
LKTGVSGARMAKLCRMLMREKLAVEPRAMRRTPWRAIRFWNA